MKYHNHLKSIYYFSVTAELLSIKKASESLYVTQAAISQQIRSLEEALDVELFHREHRSISLTTEGKKLLPHLQSAFFSIDKGIDEVMSDDDPNTIILSVFPSFASRWLIPRLGKFYKANPSISIKLSMSDKYESFADIDLGIRFIKESSNDIKSIFLMKDYLYPACHPAYLKEHNITAVKDLKKLRLLEDSKSNLSWDYWLDKMSLTKQHLGSQGDIKNRDRYDGSHYVVDSALSAQGVAMVRHSLVADAIEQKQLVKLFDSDVELEAQYYLCAPEHYFEYPKIKAFTQWLTEEINLFCSDQRI